MSDQTSGDEARRPWTITMQHLGHKNHLCKHYHHHRLLILIIIRQALDHQQSRNKESDGVSDLSKSGNRKAFSYQIRLMIYSSGTPIPRVYLSLSFSLPFCPKCVVIRIRQRACCRLVWLLPGVSYQSSTLQ